MTKSATTIFCPAGKVIGNPTDAPCPSGSIRKFSRRVFIDNDNAAVVFDHGGDMSTRQPLGCPFFHTQCAASCLCFVISRDSRDSQFDPDSIPLKYRTVAYCDYQGMREIGIVEEEPNRNEQLRQVLSEIQEPASDPSSPTT